MKREQEVMALVEAIQGADDSERSKAVIALGQSGDQRAVEPLIALLKHENPRVRWGAIQALWRLKNLRSLAPLCSALKDEDDYVRRAASYALGQLGDRQAIEPLLIALQDENAGVRIAASLAFGQIGAAAVKPLLAFLVKTDYSNEVEHALRAMNDPGVADILINSLKREDSRVRVYAAKLLMHFYSEEVITHLKQALTDPDSDVRHYAQVSLDVLSAKDEVEPE